MSHDLALVALIMFYKKKFLVKCCIQFLVSGSLGNFCLNHRLQSMTAKSYTSCVVAYKA